MKRYICTRLLDNVGHGFKKADDHISFWRGAGVVTEQIANLSTRKRCPGSSPGLSAFFFGN